MIPLVKVLAYKKIDGKEVRETHDYHLVGLSGGREFDYPFRERENELEPSRLVEISKGILSDPNNNMIKPLSNVRLLDGRSVVANFAVSRSKAGVVS